MSTSFHVHVADVGHHRRCNRGQYSRGDAHRDPVKLQNIGTFDFDILVDAIVFPVPKNPRKHKNKIADAAGNLVVGARKIQICSTILTVFEREKTTSVQVV